jgi:hypothetical protein
LKPQSGKICASFLQVLKKHLEIDRANLPKNTKIWHDCLWGCDARPAHPEAIFKSSEHLIEVGDDLYRD